METPGELMCTGEPGNGLWSDLRNTNMKLHAKIQLLKFGSTLIHIIFLALGVSVTGCGLWILFDNSSFISVLSSVQLQTVGVGLMVVGAVVIGVSAVGFIGVQRENRFLLVVLMVFLVVLVLGLIFITLLLFINRVKIVKTANDAMDTLITEYPDGQKRHLLDNVQHYAECCGRTGPSDWQRNPFVVSLNLTDTEVLPCSCFASYRRSYDSSFCSKNLTSALVGHGNSSYAEGCEKALGDWLKENILTMVGMDLSLMFIQMFQFALAVSLYRSFGTKALLKSVNTQSPGQAEPDQNQTYTDEDMLYQQQYRLEDVPEEYYHQ